ncbi:beta-ketoacyl synthase N-terminal-like domain-containing protein [Actinomyces sp.]|uniref:beta-ketoacyl synthase N-terminal-like domain-containing protein n=1 Tax=Actinomyces sp. TaxID=29317 RepID=UPI0026DB0F6F|nr:beta-ketoacyl synthase N-terminal-like domain-containing protein [Actinomyces sp.]MDO4899294.1 beta-ketoacyl synthase N-terminal-like domain-containing protein [Actinomyces sp.]
MSSHIDPEPTLIPIAIVGAGCVLPPTSTSLAKYRRNLQEGRLGISPTPPERWNRDDYYSTDRHAPERTYCTLGGFVDDYRFDPTPYALDPEQQKTIAQANRTQLFAIDAALQALTAAGFDRERLRAARAELYLGNMLGDEQLADYSLRHRADRHCASLLHSLGAPDGTTPDIWTTAWSSAADRRFGPVLPAPRQVLASALAPVVASAVGIHGGSALVDGACASGLLVVDVAVAALLRDDLDLVVAVGAMANMGVAGNVSFAKIGGLSGKGSYPLSDTADGLIPGEGSGAVVLRRLDRALADGDPVVGVIRGVATRSDGAGKAIYAPSSRGQVAAMRAALGQAGLTARDLDYVEVHATGTPTGDTTEIESIGQLVAQDGRCEPLTIGSGKALIGHGFPSAGIANLVKILLSFEYQRFFPTFGVEGPNHGLVEQGGVLRLLPEGGEWTQHPGHPRRAMANAFGFGGVDSSVLVEQFDLGYHKALAADPKLALTAPDTEQWLAVVGASVLLPGLPASDGLPDSVTFERAWTALSDPSTGVADDFRFPLRDVKIPPSTLNQTDRAQQLFLTTSLHALRQANLMSGRTVARPDRIATVVATASGSEASLHRNERIRAIEFQQLLETTGSECGVEGAVLQGWRSALDGALMAEPDATTEAALPGYMDNIVAGRVGNSLDLRGTNYVVDTDLSSFGAAVRCAEQVLSTGTVDHVLIGGVNAVVAPEMAEVWSQQLGAPVHPVEASVSLVVARASDVADARQVLGYLQVTVQPSSDAPESRPFTALGADGALWAARQLITMAADQGTDGGQTELRSAFQATAHRLRVARQPLWKTPVAPVPPARAALTPTSPIIVEGTDLDDLIYQLENSVGRPGRATAPGGLRLVVDPLHDHPAGRLRELAAYLTDSSEHPQFSLPPFSTEMRGHHGDH